MTASSTASPRTPNAGPRNDRRDRALRWGHSRRPVPSGTDRDRAAAECVETLAKALEPRTKGGLQAIVEQCQERYGE
jgi:hypothetical protein